MEVRLADEALFVIPASGALWTFDFGNKTETLREAAGENQGPMFQVAQARAGDSDLLLVLPTFSAPTIAEQDRIRTLLNDHDRRDPTRGGNVRPVALVIEHSVGKAVVVTEARPLGAKIAAIAALVRKCWEWDEVERYAIKVDLREFEVIVEHDGERWDARISARPQTDDWQ